jgi:hypothetical protein
LGWVGTAGDNNKFGGPSFSLLEDLEGEEEELASTAGLNDENWPQ